MNYCTDCRCYFERPGTCNCYAETPKPAREITPAPAIPVRPAVSPDQTAPWAPAPGVPFWLWQHPVPTVPLEVWCGGELGSNHYEVGRA